MHEITYKGKRFIILDGVYTPSDDTFMLAESLPEEKGKVLDLCAGCGILGILVADTAKRVVLVDDDDLAIKNIRMNLEINKIRNAKALQSDLFENLREKFDFIIFNPPFLPAEYPELHYLYDDTFKKWRSVGWHAWDGGKDGREVIDRFLESFEPYLSKNGRIHLTGSSLSDYKKTVRILREKGLHVSVLSRKKFFFEELVVLEARK
jgi:release factor glutamine methyltransferase